MLNKQLTSNIFIVQKVTIYQSKLEYQHLDHFYINHELFTNKQKQTTNLQNSDANPAKLDNQQKEEMICFIKQGHKITTKVVINQKTPN